MWLRVKRRRRRHLCRRRRRHRHRSHRRRRFVHAHHAIWIEIGKQEMTGTWKFIPLNEVCRGVQWHDRKRTWWWYCELDIEIEMWQTKKKQKTREQIWLNWIVPNNGRALAHLVHWRNRDSHRHTHTHQTMDRASPTCMEKLQKTWRKSKSKSKIKQHTVFVVCL